MKARTRWPWKNVEAVEADPNCVQCFHPKSKHFVVSCHDGFSFSTHILICPNATFLSRADARVGKGKP